MMDAPRTDAFASIPVGYAGDDEAVWRALSGWNDFSCALELEIEALRAEHKELRESMRRNTEAACKRIKELEAKIDALMLEYCPDEMTSEQVANWAKHQKPEGNALCSNCGQYGRTMSGGCKHCLDPSY